MSNEEKEEEIPDWKMEALELFAGLENWHAGAEGNRPTNIEEAKHTPWFDGLICDDCDRVASDDRDEDKGCEHCCGGNLKQWFEVGCEVCGKSDFVDYSDWNCGNEECWNPSDD